METLSTNQLRQITTEDNNRGRDNSQRMTNLLTITLETPQTSTNLKRTKSNCSWDNEAHRKSKQNKTKPNERNQSDNKLNC